MLNLWGKGGALATGLMVWSTAAHANCATDFNHDGLVNIIDWAMFYQAYYPQQSCYQRTEAGITNHCADLNGSNGAPSVVDLGMFAGMLNKTVDVQQCSADLDGDGMSAYVEARFGTSPLDADTDDDTWADDDEAEGGSDPLDRSHTPADVAVPFRAVVDYRLTAPAGRMAQGETHWISVTADGLNPSTRVRVQAEDGWGGVEWCEGVLQQTGSMTCAIAIPADAPLGTREVVEVFAFGSNGTNFVATSTDGWTVLPGQHNCGTTLIEGGTLHCLEGGDGQALQTYLSNGGVDDGDVVRLGDGDWLLASALNVTKSITLAGAAESNASGGGLTRLVPLLHGTRAVTVLAPTVTLLGLDVADLYGLGTSGVWATNLAVDVTLDRVVLEGLWSAGDGAAVLAENTGELTLLQSELWENVAEGSGGGLARTAGTTDIRHTFFALNDAADGTQVAASGTGEISSAFTRYVQADFTPGVSLEDGVSFLSEHDNFVTMSWGGSHFHLGGQGTLTLTDAIVHADHNNGAAALCDAPSNGVFLEHVLVAYAAQLTCGGGNVLYGSPQFIDGSYLEVGAGSPVWDAASDGTNIGVWQ